MVPRDTPGASAGAPSGPGSRFCPSCGTAALPSDRFCTTCGADLNRRTAPVAPVTLPAAGGGNSRLGWAVAALLFGALVLAVAFPAMNRSVQGPAAGPPSGQAPLVGAAPNVDLSTMTPRQAAERLFDRVMRAVALGDTVEARNFAPMAVAAYELAEPLDLSGTFDLSLLQAVNRDFQGALTTAESALATTPDHLFLLSAAGAAASALADTARADGHYQRLLDVYDAQIALDLPEYRSRPNLLPGVRAEAENFLARR